MKVELVDITKRYGNREIFTDFNLEIESGEFVILSGESGCGKSTLLNLIGFLDNDFKGQIIINDKTIKRKKEVRRLLAQDFSFVFQDFGLVDNLSVYDNLSILKCMQNIKKSERIEVIRSALTKVGLEKEIDSKIRELSGGEQQRVAITKSILKKSKIILADEPVASLDSDNAEVIMKLLKKMNEENVTVVLVTHQKELFHYADRIIYLSKPNT